MGGFCLLLLCSHLISIGRWLADMSLRLACLLIGGRRRRGRSRIGLFGSERWHIRQFRQIAVLPVSILEFGFPTSGIRTHPLPSGFGVFNRLVRTSASFDFPTPLGPQTTTNTTSAGSQTVSNTCVRTWSSRGCHT